MKICDIIRERKTVSFEVFPPKPGMDKDLRGIRTTLAALTAASPDFVSVTYGAGGSNRSRTLDIVAIADSLGMLPLSHMTSVGSTKQETAAVLDALREQGVENLLALRGDLPQDLQERPLKNDFPSAIDLSAFALERGNFCIGGAAYPEGHQQSVSPQLDVEFMRRKVENGVSFFITQLFFENDLFFSFMDRVRSAGIDTPVIAGVMPVLAARQIRRIVEISGCCVPPRLAELLDRYIDDDASMARAGADYAAEQIRDLWDRGANGIHLYTMNKASQALDILLTCGLFAPERRSVAR